MTAKRKGKFYGKERDATSIYSSSRSARLAQFLGCAAPTAPFFVLALNAFMLSSPADIARSAMVPTFLSGFPFSLVLFVLYYCGNGNTLVALVARYLFVRDGRWSCRGMVPPSNIITNIIINIMIKERELMIP